MPDRSDVIYYYDGTFEGLLCCVFESYEKKEIPADILLCDTAQTTFLPVKEIETEPDKAARVLTSIPKKIGSEALAFVQDAFLTCLPGKEKQILLFLRLGFRYGQPVMNMLTNDVVNTLSKAVRSLKNESHFMKEFIRFSDFQGALVAEIEPKNFVLPYLTRHFCERYPEEKFLIYDHTHGMALIYQNCLPEILAVENLEMPEPDENELFFRNLWRMFYNTIEIKSRHNPRCRMSHMPKRYWKYMTEFGKMERVLPKRESIAPVQPGLENRYALPPCCRPEEKAKT